MSNTEAPVRRTTSKKPGPPAPAEFIMPKVRIGQLVIWRMSRLPNEEKFAAVVTSEGDRAISVSMFYPGAYALTCKNGVRHAADPEIEIIDRAEEGVWDFALDAEEFNMSAIREMGQMAALIDTLHNRVQALEAFVAKFTGDVAGEEKIDGE